MTTAVGPNRREIVSLGLAGAVTLGMGDTSAAPAAQPAAAAPVPRKSKIRIGARINEAWLKSERDDDLRFLKQIGVDWVDIELVLVKGYQQTGCFTKADWSD